MSCATGFRRRGRFHEFSLAEYDFHFSPTASFAAIFVFRHARRSAIFAFS